MRSDPCPESIETGDPLGQWENAPSDWQETKLWDLANYVNGRAFKPIDFTPHGLRVIKITELKYGVSGDTALYSGPYENKHLLDDGDLLFAWSGNPETSLDSFRWRGDRAILNQHIFRVIPREGIDKTYLYFLFKFLRSTFIRTARDKATSMGHVKMSDLRRLIACVPPVAEQRAIASILVALDDKIELNRRMNETLEALAQSLFKSWFVDPTQSALPKGWRHATIAELCDINAWTLSKTDELDRIQYIEISEVSRGSIANLQVFQRGKEPSRARRRLRHGDTVLSTVRPERGSYFLCLNPSPNLIASTGFAVLTPTKAPWSFIHAALTHSEVFEHLGQHADGGAYPAVRPEIIGEWEVPWPDRLEKVELFHRASVPLYERAEHNRVESRTLAALRDALLPKLLSGELRVPIPEKEVTAHA